MKDMKKVSGIKSLINEHRDEIKELFKAEVCGIFGSYARGDQKPDSDIDVLVNFYDGATLLDLVGLGDYLEELLGPHVDVISARALHPLIRDDVLKEMVNVIPQ